MVNNMGEPNINVKIPSPYEHKKFTQVLDPTVFPICTIKEKEIGAIRKKVWYVHRFPDRWDVLQVYPAIAHYSFKIDSSGFRCSTFSEYCRVKHGINRKHNWLKVHISTGVNTNIVAVVVITDEYGNDSPQFKKLVEETAKNFEIKEIYGDPAYSSAKNLQVADKYNAKAFIPFKKNTTGRNSGALWRKTFHFFQMHREEFEKHYHKRSNAESTFHAIKRKFGDSIKSKDRVAQENEMLCKIIAYNITVLVHEMVQLNGTSEFLSFNGLQKEEILKQL